jgi:carboxyl-terminal processing protease
VDGGAAPSLVGSITTDRPQNEVAAGETLKFTAKITNKGPGIAGQVRATLKGDDPMFEGREFVFGKIKPGETRSFVVPIKIPKDALSRVDPLHMEVNEQHGAKTQLEASDMVVRVDGPQRPAFSYAYQVIDDAKGDNGDGLIQRGEAVRLHVTVKNIGHGKSNETLAQLRNLSDEGVFINKGRFNVDNLQPNESKSVDFTFDVRPEYHGDNVKVEMTVYDAVLHEFVTDKLSFPVVEPKQVATASGKVAVTQAATEIHGGASKDAPVVGTADKGSAFELTGDAGDFWRVKLADAQPGFIAKTAAQSGAGNGKVATYTPAWQVEPPNLTVQSGAALVDTSTIHITGTAHAEHKVADVFIFVSNHTAKIDRRKVFYSSNRKAQNQREEALNVDVPLWPGANVVTVVARESPQVQSQQTLIVQRREPRVAAETHATPEVAIEPGKATK